MTIVFFHLIHIYVPEWSFFTLEPLLLKVDNLESVPVPESIFEALLGL